MTLVNGIPSDSIPADDRGLLYGDGVFRTMRRVDGISLCWPRHYRKLAADCAALGLCCPDVAVLETELAQLPQDCVSKIIITRGHGTRGYAVGQGVAPTRIVTASPLPLYPENFYHAGVKVHLCTLRLASQPRIAGIKHLNRLENVLARMEWNDAEIAEGLLQDEKGDVIEGTMSNLFAYRDGVLHTPDLSRCGVAGVQRERILEFSSELGMKSRIGSMTLESLMQADEIMLSNSIIGLWQVREFNGRRWPDGQLTVRLRPLLDGRND